MKDRSSSAGYDSVMCDAIRVVLTAAGIERKDHAKELARILDLSIAQIYKKFAGNADWFLSQIRTIEKEYGVSLMRVDVHTDQPADAPEAIPVESTLHVAGRTFPCLATFGNKYFFTPDVDFVGIQDNGAWSIFEAKDAPQKVTLYRVEGIQMILREPKQYSIAVLDDEVDAADVVCEMLLREGYAATAFYTIDDLAQAMLSEQYDAYVLDWKIGSSTSQTLIESIRSGANPDAPIFLLTGKFAPEREDELSDIVVNYRVRYLDKPIRQRMLASIVGEALQESPRA